MASFGRFLFWRHLRAGPNQHVLHYRRGRLVRSGAGLAYWFNPLSAAVAQVPVEDCETTFLLREHFRSLPHDVFDAARIDGAGHVRQMLQIALPMSIPIATTLLLLAAVAHWNAYLWPLIVTNTQDMRTLPIGVQALKYKTGEIPQWNVVMAGATMVLLPLIAIFLAAQKKFVEGAVQGAINRAGGAPYQAASPDSLR